MLKAVENDNRMRPYHCLDPENCSPIFTKYDAECQQKGASWFCYGKLKDKHIFICKETEHINDYCECFYTPLKGIIRSFLNSDDAFIQFRAFAAILDHAKPFICDFCGPFSRARGPLLMYKKEDNSYGKCCWQCKINLNKKEE